jgi:hypothetical protein
VETHQQVVCDSLGGAGAQHCSGGAVGEPACGMWDVGCGMFHSTR